MALSMTAVVDVCFVFVSILHLSICGWLDFAADDRDTMQLAMRPRQTMKSLENFSQYTVKTLHHLKFKECMTYL